MIKMLEEHKKAEEWFFRWRLFLILLCIGIYLMVRLLIGEGYFEAGIRTIYGKGRFKQKLKREERRRQRRRK